MSNSTAETRRPCAWQPLTPRGIAAFAHARLGRLLLMQSVFAVIATVVLVHVLYTAWFPRIAEAINSLPAGTELRRGQLHWPTNSPTQLSESRFLALSVDLDHSGKARSPAHLQVEFGRRDFRIFSIFGYLQFAYQDGWSLKAGRDELQPWWGAWGPALLALAGIGAFCGFMVTWAFLSSVYAVPGLLLAFVMNRSLSIPQSWRLSGAALMPGALLLTASIYMYRLGMLDPIRLLAAVGCHFLVGWVCLALGCWRLEKSPIAVAKTNPFQTPASNTKVS